MTPKNNYFKIRLVIKKYWPIILFLAGLVVFAGVYFFLIKGGKTSEVDEDAQVAEIPLADRPVVSLVPREDGHWLKLRVEGIKVKAATLDYELLYKTDQGTTQGVPGTIALDSQSMSLVERDLLMGSESSGKFRYDEGVEEGTITLRFRNEKGKLVGKLSTQFHFQSDTKELTSLDGEFSFTLAKTPKGEFFVVMQTFGVPAGAPQNISKGPYGVFSSDDSLKGEPVGLWKEIEYGGSGSLGIFVTTSE